MKARDYILHCIGLGYTDDYLDRIEKGFDVQLEDDEIEDAVRRYYGDAGNRLAGILFSKAIDRAVIRYGAGRDRFGIWINANDSSLSYMGRTVHCMDDIRAMVDDGIPEGGAE